MTMDNNKAIAAGKGQGSSFLSCSICSFKSYIAMSNIPSRAGNGGGNKKTSPFLLPPATAGMLLDASFVNIHSPSDTYSNEKNGIDSILNDALLSHNNIYNSTGRGGDSFYTNKGSLEEASMKMDAYAEAAMEMIREAENSDNNSVEDVKGGEKYYCHVCIDR